MGFAPEQLRDKALAAIVEVAEQSKARPVERSKALGFALAYLWAYSSRERGMFVWFWRSLADPHDIGRSQNVNASLNGIYRALGLSPPGARGEAKRMIQDDEP
jgi:hypothetical protein